MLLEIGDPREIAQSFTSTIEASTWADETSRKLWQLGGSPEARLIRRAVSKVSSMLFLAMYYKPKINLNRVLPYEHGLAFNDMNLLLFKWMDNVLCKFERDNTSVAGPRESGKTILTVECAIPYAGLHALTGRELEALGTVIAEWNDDSIESLSTQWSPYTVVISDTERQAARHMKKVYNYLTGPGCMLQWDWPKMCRAQTEHHTKKKVATSAEAVEFKSGLRVEAYGMNTGMLGSRHESTRPGYALLDDIEPGVNWTTESAKTRQSAIHSVVLPLSRILRTMLIATPQTDGSTADTLARYARGEVEDLSEEEWLHEWNANVIEPWRDEDKTITFWEGHPEITPVKLLQEEKKSTWGVSYDSRPKDEENVWWSRSMFNRVEMPSELHRIICFIDPKKKESVQKRQSKNAWVFAAWVWGQPFLVLGGGTSTHVGRRLARDVIASMQGSGFIFDALIYEDNATGETLGQDFRDEDLGEIFGIEADGYTETANKEIRAKALLSTYEAERINHLDSMAVIVVENGLMSYRGGKRNADMVDADGGAIYMLSLMRSRGQARTKGRSGKTTSRRKNRVYGQ